MGSRRIVFDLRDTTQEHVRSLQDSHDGRPFERIGGERHTRRQHLATVHHRLNEDHDAIVAAPLESTHILDRQNDLPSAPLHELTDGVQGRFGQRAQECHTPSIRLTPPIKRTSPRHETYADILATSRLGHDVEVRESRARPDH